MRERSVLLWGGLAAAVVIVGGAGAPPAKPPAFDPVTKVDGENLQVVTGQRAVFHLDENGRPALDAAEPGKLADAHLKGVVKETFAPPAEGKMAAALDGSAEKRLSILKVWNGLPHPVEYRLATLSLRQGKYEILPMKTCALAPGQVYSRSWPQPVVAVAMARFVEASAETPACEAQAPR